MVREQTADRIFVDHYYTLGIDIDANGEVVEDVYWSIIRDARTGKIAPLSREQMDDLNEAYRVLTHPELRKAYDQERAEALGPNARPQAPLVENEEAPLRVMEKQRTVLQREERKLEPVMVVEQNAMQWFPYAATLAGIAMMVSMAIIKLLI